MSDIRYNPIEDEYSIISPERLRRPDCHGDGADSGVGRSSGCPFCEGRESMTPPEIFAIREGGEPNGPGWKTRVVPNLYKAVRIEAPWRKLDGGMYDDWEGFGAHEVVIDTPIHHRRMDGWEIEEYRYWLKALRSRLKDLTGDIRLVYFSIFKNHGFYAGATQEHPHTQIIALPIVPKKIVHMMDRALQHFLEHGKSHFEDIVCKETKYGKRIVGSSENFIVLAPFSSSFSFETTIVSLEEGVVCLSDLGDDRIEELSALMKRVFGALYSELGDFDFNILFNTPPMQKNYATEHFFDHMKDIWRFEIKIVPRLFRLGGFEIGSGIHIDPVTPEETARLLSRYL
jgi:UDPglucose--hexose-1-phosphate uridylyltransferase